MFSLCVTLMFSVRSEIVITGVGMNSLYNFTKYYSCEISLNVNFKFHHIQYPKNNQIEVENNDRFRDKKHAKNVIISRE